MFKKISKNGVRFSGYKKNFTCKILTLNIKYSNKNIIYGLLILGLIFGLGGCVSAQIDAYIISPSVNHYLYTNASIPIMYQNLTEIRVVDLADQNVINYTMFEFFNGSDWVLIGMDNYGGSEGLVPDESGHGRSKNGSYGWSIYWDISGLPEGNYSIRATMFDAAGNNDTVVREVYLDPTPPLITITSPASFLQMVGGLVAFNATTGDEDVSSMTLTLVGGSPPYIDQRQNHNFGSAVQTGPTCAPTAAANGLWSRPELRDGFANASALAQNMSRLMNTTVNGTSDNGTTGGLKTFFAKRGLGCDNKNGWKVDYICSNNATKLFEIYAEFLKKDEIILIGTIVTNASSGNVSGGHVVTGDDANLTSSRVSFIDPNGGSYNAPSDGWNLGDWDYTPDCLWIISPKNMTNATVNITVVDTGECTGGVCTTEHNTVNLTDGYYLYMLTVIDSMGNKGEDLQLVYVNNLPPMPEIIDPLNGSEVCSPVKITAIDTAGSEDINHAVFEYWNSTLANWDIIGVDEDDGDGWNIEWGEPPEGEYVVRVTMYDAAGNNNTDEIIVIIIDNTPPVANAGPDQTVLLGTIVNFDGSNSSDPDGTIVSYHWDFGDPYNPSPGTGEFPEHNYSHADVYVVTLTVTDNNGTNSSDTMTVVVESKIIMLELNYKDGAIYLTDKYKKNGFAPDRRIQPDGENIYSAIVYSKSDRTLYTFTFDVPNFLNYDEPDGENLTGGVIELNETDFTLIIPYFENAAWVYVYYPNDTLALEVNVTNLQDKGGSNCKTLVNNGLSASLFDIVFVGDNYTAAQLAQFAADVNTHQSTLLSVAPFSNHTGNINIHWVNESRNLGCQYNCNGMARLICCNSTAVMNLASQCPADEIIVLLNSNTYGGSGMRGSGGLTTYAVSYSGNDTNYPNSEGDRVTVHEFGHSFGNLHDEYTYLNPYWGPADGPNCDNAVPCPPCPKFTGIPGAGCYPGCTNINWCRGDNTGGDVMLTLSNLNFGPVCTNALNGLLNQYPRPVCNSTTPCQCGYILTQNRTFNSSDFNTGPCSGDGLEIGSAGITLDCNGVQIIGSKAFGSTGIKNVFNDVTIKNCNVMNFNNGIHITGVSDNIIDNNTVSSTTFFHGDGIWVETSTWNNITNNNVSSYKWGIGLDTQSDNNLVEANTVYSCQWLDQSGNWIGYGINAYASSVNTMKNNNITNNSYGIYLYGGSNFNNISDNKISNNINTGIKVSYCDPGWWLCGGNTNNTILRNNVSLNGGDGVYIDVFCKYTNITLNNIQNNAQSGMGAGIYLDGNGSNVVSNNNITNNRFDGISIGNLVNETINSNKVCSNNNFDFNVLSIPPGNYGDDNSCDKPSVWNDNGAVGCTWSCPTGVQTSTNTGTAYFSTNKGMIANLVAVNESSLNSTGKPNLTFIHGFFEFNITGLLLGENVTVKIELLGNLPANSQYWKYGPNCNNNNITEWYQIPMGSNDGDNIITINLTDGGLGDDNCTPDGMIIDQGGPGSITIDSMLCDGGKQDAFNPGDRVCTFGNTTGTCDIYKCGHRDNYTGYNLTTNCANISTITGVFDNVSVCTGGDANCTINSAYDLVLDCDRDGYYNESTDAIDDSNTVQGGMDGGFYLTPEPMAAAIFIAGLSFLYGIARIRKK
ncbi:MAG: hypothetical protein A7315_06610 [Candidatus Altiarchaeales archaeon WOR_SM1_79]|nr:MAG: hypothetical protein A7315_06610 [Candidatus Altiarchaeales archaeon WOR_SM1_79]